MKPMMLIGIFRYIIIQIHNKEGDEMRKIIIPYFLFIFILVKVNAQDTLKMSSDSYNKDTVYTTTNDEQNKIVYFSAGFGAISGIIVAGKNSHQTRGQYDLGFDDGIKGALIGATAGMAFGIVMKSIFNKQQRNTEKDKRRSKKNIVISPIILYNKYSYIKIKINLFY
jgi:hypothetical protein